MLKTINDLKRPLTHCSFSIDVIFKVSFLSPYDSLGYKHKFFIKMFMFSLSQKRIIGKHVKHISFLTKHAKLIFF